MISVFIKTIPRLLSRPSFVNAALCSCALHVGAISGTCFWWSQPPNHFSLNGHRNAICVDLTCKETVSHEPVETAIEALATQAVVSEERPVVEPAEAPDLAPQESPTKKIASTVHINRPSDLEADVEFANDMEPLVQETALSRCEEKSSEVEVPVTDSPSPVVRHVVDMPSSIAVKQSLGLNEETPPDFSDNRPPPYPAAAVRRQLEGTVLLRLHISSTGRVERADIVTSSGHSVLDLAALKAVQAWRGHPALHNGEEVATSELLPIRFRL